MPDITLDFQSTNFEKDRSLLANLLLNYVKNSNLLGLKGNNKKIATDDDKSTVDSKSELEEGNLESTSSIFEITTPTEIAGWSFAKLIISSVFLFDILKDITTNSKASENELGPDKLFQLIRKYKSRGKQYLRSDYKLTMFVIWIDYKLKKLGSDSFIKIGKDMEESSSPGGLPSGAGFTAAGFGRWGS